MRGHGIDVVASDIGVVGRSGEVAVPRRRGRILWQSLPAGRALPIDDARVPRRQAVLERILQLLLQD